MNNVFNYDEDGKIIESEERLKQKKIAIAKMLLNDLDECAKYEKIAPGFTENLRKYIG